MLPTILTWLPYGIIAVLLYFIFLLLSKNKKIKERKEHYKTKSGDLKRELATKTITTEKLEAENSRLINELKEEKIQTKFLDDYKRSQEKKQQGVIEDAAIELSINTDSQTIRQANPQKTKQASPNIKYARYADMGDGFSKTELMDDPDSETIFELTLLSANAGQFKVVSNANAQRYALSNPQYFLGKTCQYDSFANNTSNITTEIPGVIQLIGSKWAIMQPAKISFS